MDIPEIRLHVWRRLAPAVTGEHDRSRRTKARLVHAVLLGIPGSTRTAHPRRPLELREYETGTPTAVIAAGGTVKPKLNAAQSPQHLKQASVVEDLVEPS
jgi:hypothetical protein